MTLSNRAWFWFDVIALVAIVVIVVLWLTQ
jgi:hypothetical protein